MQSAMGPFLPALSIALQHTSFLEPGTLCNLLTTSKVVRSVVGQQCMGQLPVNVLLKNADSVKHLAAWLSSHGQLLKSLEWDLISTSTAMEALAVSHIAEALHEAAAAAPLQLQSLTMPACASGFLLQQLPAKHLMQLYFYWPSSAARSNRIVAELPRLTGLQDLTIMGSPSTEGSGANKLFRVLAHLTNLSRVCLQDPVREFDKLELVPQQLQVLELGLARTSDNLDMFDDDGSDSAYPVYLGHLTALTYLNCLIGELNHSVKQCDVLPPNLKVLYATDCVSCEPLLQLQQLQQLDLSNTRAPAQQLQLLSRLTALSSVSLTYSDDDSDGFAVSATAAAAWGSISGLTQLSIHSNCFDMPLSATVAQGVGHIPWLQALHICSHYMTKATALQLMKAIRQLTALRSLRLSRLQLYRLEGEVETAVPPQEAAAGTYNKLVVIRSVARIVSRLPRLRLLSLRDMPFGQGAAAALAGASQLTSLSLSGCGLNSEMVRTMLVDMSQLRVLQLGDNKGVLADCVPTIMQISQLTYLGLSGTGMRMFDAKRLTKLTGLKVEYPWNR